MSEDLIRELFLWRWLENLRLLRPVLIRSAVRFGFVLIDSIDVKSTVICRLWQNRINLAHERCCTQIFFHLFILVVEIFTKELLKMAVRLIKVWELL